MSQAAAKINPSSAQVEIEAPKYVEVGDQVVLSLVVPKALLQGQVNHTQVIPVGRHNQIIWTPTAPTSGGTVTPIAPSVPPPARPAPSSTKGGSRKSYSDSEKRALVLRMLEEGKSANRVASEAGCSQPSLSKWKKDYLVAQMLQGQTPQFLAEKYSQLNADTLKGWLDDARKAAAAS